MRFELKPPYTDKYTKGYLRRRPEDDRQIVTLVRTDGSQTRTSYARYLMCVHLEHELAPGLEVDHIDNDKTNDTLENLQVLTCKEHYEKTVRSPRQMVELKCPICSRTFKFKKGSLMSHPNPTCSKQCGYIKGAETSRSNKLSFNKELK